MTAGVRNTRALPQQIVARRIIQSSGDDFFIAHLLPATDGVEPGCS